MLLRWRSRAWLTAFAFALAGPAWATNEYWDFNDRTKVAVSSTNVVQTSIIAFGAPVFDVETYGPGTEVNRVGSTPAGYGLSYLELGYAFSDQVMEFKGLNFSGQTNVSLSYAFRSTEIFGPGELILFEYSTNGGASYSAEGFMLLDGLDFSNWQTVSRSFGTHLNGATNAAIKVSTLAAFSMESSTQYDNIQAVPEPSMVALVGLALGLGFFGLRKKQRTA